MFFHNGSSNRGCEAIVRTGVQMIKEKNPNAIIDLASSDPDSDTIIPGLNNLFEHTRRPISKWSIDGIRSIVKIKLFKDESFAFRKVEKDITDKVNDYDVFLSIGGDNYCYGEQPGIYEIDRVIKKAGKKLVLWGASIGEEDLSPAKIEDLKLFDLILARETITVKTLENHGLKNVKLCADGAFTMDVEKLELPSKWLPNNTIGFNYSPLVRRKNSNSYKAAKDLIKYILNTTDMVIALTPHVIQKDNDDSEVLKDFYNEFKHTDRVILLPNNLNAIQYKGYISRMRYFIGARTHSTIAAYSQLVPTMVLGYSVKSKGIAKDIFGEEKLVLGLDEISDTKKLISKFEELRRDEKSIKETLETKIPEIKLMAKKSANYLMQV